MAGKALESQPVATVSGESWYFFGHVPKLPPCRVRQHNGPRYLPVWRETGKCQRGLLRHGRDLRHEAKNHKNSLGIYELSWHQACSDCRVTAVWRPDIPAVAR